MIKYDCLALTSTQAVAKMPKNVLYSWVSAAKDKSPVISDSLGNQPTAGQFTPKE